jgi:hypothetical protein
VDHRVDDPIRRCRVGAVDLYWVFSAVHCDGLGADTTPGANCFPAGETLYGLPVPLAFAVTPGHN